VCVLSHLRYHDKDRVLWVDAICIDQTNDNEKTHQGRMMRRIYKGAKSVVAWLGPKNRATAGAIQTMKRLIEDRILHWRPDGRSNRSGPPISVEEAFGLHAWFGTCEWWDRIWTVQEYALANDLVFVCDDIHSQGKLWRV
jgi:hypothetical protein